MLEEKCTKLNVKRFAAAPGGLARTVTRSTAASASSSRSWKRSAPSCRRQLVSNVLTS
jgi:hypothetical protein